MISAAAFTLFCVVCAILAFARHPVYGLYFYLATTFVYPPGRWWGYLFHDLRWALLASGVVVLAVLFHRGKLNAKPIWLANGPAVLLTLYAALMWLQTPLALDLDAHLRGSTFFAKYLVAFWFVYRVVDSKERVRDVLLAHVLGCALLGVFCLFTGRSGGRLDGVGGPGIDDANTLAMYLATGAIVAGGLVLTQTGWRRYLSLASLALIGEGFVLANTRGAFLGLVAGGIAFALCLPKEHRPRFWALAFAGLVGFAVIVDKAFVERMYTISDVTSEDEHADKSARSRLVLAEAQLQMFLDYPLGVGHRGTAVLSPRYLDREWLTGEGDRAARSSHNTFLTALVEQGVPGATLLLALLLWIVAAGRRVRQMRGPNHDPTLATLSASIVAALVAILVAGNSADFLLAEVQFWLLAVFVSAQQLAASSREVEVPRTRTTEIRRMPV